MFALTSNYVASTCAVKDQLMTLAVFAWRYVLYIRICVFVFWWCVLCCMCCSLLLLLYNYLGIPPHPIIFFPSLPPSLYPWIPSLFNLRLSISTSIQWRIKGGMTGQPGAHRSYFIAMHILYTVNLRFSMFSLYVCPDINSYLILIYPSLYPYISLSSCPI